MRLFIEPTDMLMFRSGRPFDAGQDNFATSLFPPTPETMQGAVRAMIASYWHPDKNIAQAFQEDELKNLIGDQNSYGRFQITGLSLGRYKRENKEQKVTIERLLPAPAHMIREKICVDKSTIWPKVARVHLRTPHELETTTQTNFPGARRHYLASDIEVPKSVEEKRAKLQPVKGWITEDDLRRVLANSDAIDIEIIEPDDVYTEEPRLGIVVQADTRSTKDGFLYQTVMIRMNPGSKHPLIENPHRYGFVVDIELEPRLPSDEETQQTLHIPDSGWMTIGGEQRSAYFHVVASPQQTHEEARGKNTLVYLATPAAFGQSNESGWLPPKPHNQPLTAAIENYTLIGGWKLNPGDAGGANKAMRRCVPAGSVYFYQGKIDVPQALSDYGKEIGYGIAYKGEW
jgi:CRISPR-associated protein Cmr3